MMILKGFNIAVFPHFLLCITDLEVDYIVIWSYFSHFSYILGLMLQTSIVGFDFFVTRYENKNINYFLFAFSSLILDMVSIILISYSFVKLDEKFKLKLKSSNSLCRIFIGIWLFWYFLAQENANPPKKSNNQNFPSKQKQCFLTVET